MSGLSDLFKLDCIVSDCLTYDKELPGAAFFVVLDFYPLVLTVGLFAISILRQEIYLFLLSLGLSFNWLICFFFQQVVFKQNGAFPNCGSPLQMPSFASQQIVFFQTMVAFYAICWTKKIYWTNTILLHFFSSLVVWARIFIGINTVQQLLVGAIFGLVLGTFYHCVLFYLIYPHFKTILKWKIMKWRGFEDSLCKKERKVYIVN